MTEELTAKEQDLVGEIANLKLNFGKGSERYVIGKYYAKQILALIKEAGYKSPKEIEDIITAKSIIFAQASDRAFKKTIITGGK